MLELNIAMRLPPSKQAQPSTPRLSDAPGEDVDRELARLMMLEGDPEALVHFVDRHIAFVHKHLQRRLGPGHESLIDDITRATFNIAIRRLRPYVQGTARTTMRLWLLRLAERELSRRRKAIAALTEGRSESEELSELREAIATLPPKEQSAISMALFDGMPAHEIAGALGVRKARAMRVLRKGLRRTGSKLALAHAEVG